MSKDRGSIYTNGAGKCPVCHKYTVTGGYCAPCNYTMPSKKCNCHEHRNMRKAS